MAMLWLCAVVAVGLVMAVPASGQVSGLWGENGEKWQAGGRLPDFSFAGYQRGEKPIPDVPVVANVKDFGAVGDGVGDDTEAFRRAVAEAKLSEGVGAILIPAGRYLVTDIVEIKRSGVVLRGEGPEKTTIYINKTLQEVKPNMAATTDGRPTSNYSWSGGFFWMRGSFGSQQLATVTKAAKLGQSEIEVSSTEKLKVGQTIEVQVRDTAENTLAEHLYEGQPGGMTKLKGSSKASLTARITKIEGSVVGLDRALRFDTREEWQPRVLSFEPTVKECGIENLRFEFPVTPYKGHFTEWGFNPMAFSGVADCWARNIVIDECDSGLFPSGRFCTFENITFNSSRAADEQNATGHHGIYLGGDDNLFTGFVFNMRFIHDISVSHCAGNVISDGRGMDLCFDHHKRAPYANLYTNIDMGAGARPWKCGGGADLGKHTAARETFWNLRAKRDIAWPFEGFGPDMMNLVGIQSEKPAIRAGKWFEPGEVTPRNLHLAQVKRRLGR